MPIIEAWIFPETLPPAGPTLFKLFEDDRPEDTIGMAIKKKVTRRASSRKTANDQETTPAMNEAYEKAIVEFGEAMQLLHAGNAAEAGTRFEEIARANTEEPVLAERARTYASICAGKLAGAPVPPVGAEESYLLGVFKANQGEVDDAILLLDQAIHERPNLARFLYARACAFALKGSTENAISDLRQAIDAEPTTRFNAVNDPDFEKIREEPAFIDIIEPTPSGV